jgi:large conductance mechanosensitive channel
MLTGLKNFLMRGNIIVAAVGLVVALAFSGLVTAFTTDVVDPLIARLQGSHSIGLGVQLGAGGDKATFVNLGQLISAIVYFVVYLTVVYVAIVLPYKKISARRGMVVFGDPPATKTCPACLSSDLPAAASKCLHCGSDQPVPVADPAAPTAG